MAKAAFLGMLALCLTLDVIGLKREQCPPGYRCRERLSNPSLRSFVFQNQEEMDIEICEAGTYSPGGAEECTPCEKGTYAAKPGAPACYVCPKGHMCPQANVAPEQCPVGTYNDLTRQTCCRTCPPGQFTWLKGMFQCDDCPSGYKCRAGKKLPCEKEAIANIPINAQWAQHEVIVAGGHEKGEATNQLYWPSSVFVDDDDQTMIIADWGNHRVVQWKIGDTNGQVVAGGHGVGNRLDQLICPSDVLIDKETDSLIICDSNNRRVVRWSRRNGTTQGENLIDNIECYGLAMDDQRYLYVSDGDNHAVRRYRIGDKNGIVVAGGHGNGTGLNQFHWPSYIFVDQQQTLYVSDTENDRVMKWDKGSTEGIIIAGGEPKPSYLSRQLSPLGLFVDTLGTLYVVGHARHQVTRWPKGAKNGTVILDENVLGPRGYKVYGIDGGLSFDRHGNLYVVDTNNHKIQQFLIKKT